MTEVRPFAFILMPFENTYDDIYSLGIKHVAEANDVLAERVDEQNFSETILERIYRQIDSCDFVIAEMTGRNPNVFYEVGYAHAKGKLCALVTQSADDIPFDLKHHTHVVYNGSVKDLREKLSPKVEWLKKESERRKIETISIEAAAKSGFLEKKDWFHRGNFDLQIDLNNTSNKRSPEIDAIYLTTTKVWTLMVGGEVCAKSGVEGSTKRIRHLVNPKLKRLAAGAFSQERVNFARTLWWKPDGEESRDEYTSKGNVEIEVSTSEGVFRHTANLMVTFEEFPF